MGYGGLYKRHLSILPPSIAVEQKPTQGFIGKVKKWFDITSLPKTLDIEPVIYLQQDKKWETRFIYKEV